MLQRSRKLVFSGPDTFLGSGMVRLMGLWNLRLRGSNVTMGLTEV